MNINIKGRGQVAVSQIHGLEHFIVQSTGEVLHLAKDRSLDLWHIVRVVVPVKKQNNKQDLNTRLE